MTQVQDFSFCTVLINQLLTVVVAGLVRLAAAPAFWPADVPFAPTQASLLTSRGVMRRILVVLRDEEHAQEGHLLVWVSRAVLSALNQSICCLWRGWASFSQPRVPLPAAHFSVRSLAVPPSFDVLVPE
jgi:hypothetical protein